MNHRTRHTRCADCNDHGRLTVWHGVSVKACKPGTIRERENWKGEGRPPRLLGERFTLYTVAVACTCPEGNRWSIDAPEGRKLVRFDPERMLIATDKGEQSQEELRVWVAERCKALSAPVPWTPPNYADGDYTTVSDDDFGE